MLRQQLLDTSRGRIVMLLRQGNLTADDIASKLKLTASAVRAQLTGMERDGVVQRVGQPPGATRPSQVFELTPDRVRFVSRLMNEQLGAITEVEGNGAFVIRGAGCPLAALTGKHPAVCLAMESFVGDVIGATASECCDRTGRPRCCFEVAHSSNE